ncbi:MAG TPA: S9 family peptidase [Gaiellaceae bacterium]|jgi:dipeptidyl aminopeptidase/acylaminoacyl peptidase
MKPEDVFQLTGVGDPRVRPGGQDVAYVVWSIDGEANEYRTSIWLARTDGSEPPRRFTTGKQDAQPRWSPDGDRLAFVAKRGGDDAHRQLYVMPADGGEPVCLTDLKEDVGEPAWSPDGTKLAFSARVPDAEYEEEDERKRRPRRFKRLQFKLDSVGWTGDRRRHLYVVPADGSGEATQVTDGDFEDSRPTWTPDGKSIAFASARSENWDIELLGDIYVVPAEGGEPTRLTAGDSNHYAASYSPDGKWLAVKWDPGGYDFPRHVQIAVVDAETGRDRRVLTPSLDRTCDPYPELREPIWDGDSIVFGIEDGGDVHLYRVSPEGGEPELVVGGQIVLSGYDVRDGQVVRTGTTAPSLSELYVGEKQLTNVGREFASGRELVAPERFTATSKDGSEVDAWLVRPAGFEEGRRYPVLLNIHGGPFTQYGNGFFDEFQVYAGGGYAVVYCNPRGSSGYSEEWGRAIMGPGELGPGWGTVDYEDVMGALDSALEQFDFLDPDRLGVMGGSYGGFMTSWIVGKTNRFKAACSERGVNQMVSMYGSSDIGWAFKGYHGEFVHDAVDMYLQMSPWTYAKEIETPLLILHSEQDLRCNVEQAEQLFTTLRLLGRDVELVRFPAESHELTRSGNPAHRVQRFELLLEWFDRYLK